MRKYTANVIIVLLALTTIVSSCKKDDKDLNEIIIAGSEFVELNGTYVPESATYYEPAITDCSATPPLYFSALYVTFTDQSTLYMTFYGENGTATIPTGTFGPGDSCEPGFITFFSPGAGTKTLGPQISAGTIKITKNGSKYDVDVDAEFNAEDGGGTIKGNFSGVPEPGDRK